MSRSQPVSAPDVAIPAARVRLPGRSPAVPHIVGSGRSCATASTMNIVVPYMSIVSPGSRTPTLSASAQASMVPAMTGVPAAIPVRADASAVTQPTGSPAQWSVGSSRFGAMSAAQSDAQVPVQMS